MWTSEAPASIARPIKRSSAPVTPALNNIALVAVGTGKYLAYYKY